MVNINYQERKSQDFSRGTPLYLIWLKNVANYEKSCKGFAIAHGSEQKKNWDDKFRTNVPGVREQVLKICQILPS